MISNNTYDLDKKAQAYIEGRIDTLQAFRSLVSKGRTNKWFVSRSKG